MLDRDLHDLDNGTSPDRMEPEMDVIAQVLAHLQAALELADEAGDLLLAAHIALPISVLENREELTE